MKVIDLLNKIENDEMEEAIFYVNGDFFYDLIVIDNTLYVINTLTKQLEMLEAKYISRFISDDVELIRLDKFEEIIEEKKIPEKLDIKDIYSCDDCQQIHINFKSTWNKINEIIDCLDYLKSKGDK